MNEQIQKLAQVAEQLADDELAHLERVHNRLYSFTEGREIYNQKFAQLIIQECIKQLIKEGNDWEQFSRNPPQGQAHNASGALFAAYRLKEDAVDMLKEHFGVKND